MFSQKRCWNARLLVPHPGSQCSAHGSAVGSDSLIFYFFYFNSSGSQPVDPFGLNEPLCSKVGSGPRTGTESCRCMYRRTLPPPSDHCGD